MASRRAQPYRKGNPFRRQGAAFKAMHRGADAFGRNPIDSKRALAKMRRKKKRRRR